MKKYTLISLALALTLIVLGAIETKAQISVSNVMDRAKTVVDKLEDEGYQVLYMKIDNIKKDAIALDSYPLTAGNKYAIIAIGDADRIQDIDLAVLDGNSELAGKDNDDSNLAIVKVNPSKSQTYKIGVKGYQMSKNDGFYAIIICRLD